MRSYLIYETKTDLPIAICYSIKECCKVLNVSHQHLSNVFRGVRHLNGYGIFVEEIDKNTLEAVRVIVDTGARPVIASQGAVRIEKSGDING